jgi:hypothetical protein
MLKRIRSQMNRGGLDRYAEMAVAGGAALGQEVSIHYADPPLFDSLLKLAGLPGNAKLPKGELKNMERWFSFAHLRGVLDTSTEEEIEQARRDWQMLARWVHASKTVNWVAVAPEIERKLKSLTGASPDPPSIQARKAQRRRPVPPPIIIQALLAFWDELAARAAVLPFLIHLRRTSWIDCVISIAAAMVDWEFERLPRLPPTIETLP